MVAYRRVSKRKDYRFGVGGSQKMKKEEKCNSPKKMLFDLTWLPIKLVCIKEVWQTRNWRVQEVDKCCAH
jgi:hypothetical protein